MEEIGTISREAAGSEKVLILFCILFSWESKEFWKLKGRRNNACRRRDTEDVAEMEENLKISFTQTMWLQLKLN